MPDSSPAKNAEFDVLDLVVLLAESWKLLLLVPLVVGALTYAINFSARTTVYQSSAIITLSSEQSFVLRASSLLEPVALSQEWLEIHDGDVVQAVSALSRSLSYERLPGSRLFVVQVRHPSSDVAQRVLTLLLNELIERGQSQADFSFTEEDVLQPPIEPVTVREGRSPAIAALMALLASGFAMLLFVFARDGLRRAAAAPEGAQKVDRIRRAFWLPNRNN